MHKAGKALPGQAPKEDRCVFQSQVRLKYNQFNYSISLN
jgi:hypothetical protein